MPPISTLAPPGAPGVALSVTPADAGDASVPLWAAHLETFVADDGTPTDDAVDLFSNHMCWFLAWMLNQQTGWPLVAVSDTDPEPTTGAFGWVHVAVQTPGGDILDVSGVHGTNDFLDHWELYCDDVEAADLTAVAAADFVQVLNVNPNHAEPDVVARTATLAAALVASVNLTA